MNYKARRENKSFSLPFFMEKIVQKKKILLGVGKSPIKVLETHIKRIAIKNAH